MTTAFVVNRRAAVLRVLLYFAIVFALGFAAGRCAAPRSAAQITPAAETSESEPGRLTGALRDPGVAQWLEHRRHSWQAEVAGSNPVSGVKRSVPEVPVVGSQLHLAAGIASWFPSPGYTAALLSFRWGTRPYLVTVSGPAGSARVRIVSFCLCVVGGSRRAIDLSPAAFQTVCGPLSMGVCRVRLG